MKSPTCLAQECLMDGTYPCRVHLMSVPMCSSHCLSAALPRSTNMLSPHMLVQIKNLKTWRLLLYVIQSVPASFASNNILIMKFYLFTCLGFFVLFPQILLQVADQFCLRLFYCDVWISCVGSYKLTQTLLLVLTCLMAFDYGIVERHEGDHLCNLVTENQQVTSVTTCHPREQKLVWPALSGFPNYSYACHLSSVNWWYDQKNGQMNNQ